MVYNWKILEIQAQNDLIVAARYFCSAFDDVNTVETEGWWNFQEPKLEIDFPNVTEEMVVDWVKNQTVQNGKNMVESRLNEQLTELAKRKKVVAPWLPQVFTPEI
jgi:hypothetical protein